MMYAALLVMLMVGWRLAIRKQGRIELRDQPLVSIIIPARNEERTISFLLHDLSLQSYQHLEVIVVDDHSQDGTVEKVEHEMKRDKRITLLSNVDHGKKSALALAIKSAKGSIIITTDADCRVNEPWVESLIPYFENAETKLVFGGVKISANALFENVQALEFASLIGSGAATAALGFPTMCNGANLAFRKDVFFEVEGYAGNIDVPSGDDEFLMRKIKEKYLDGIVFAGQRNAVVSTAPCKTFTEFMHQRIRWAGKWKHNTSMLSVALAIFIFSFQASIIVLASLFFLKRIDPFTAVILLSAKALLECIFLFKISNFFSLRWSWLSFLSLQLLYPFYVLTIGLLANVLSFSWKGRMLKTHTVSEKG